VRSTWAKNIRKNDWGEVCTRIQARKVVGCGREPTREDVQGVIGDKSWQQITVEEVRDAFDTGREVCKHTLQHKNFSITSGLTENRSLDDEVC